MMGKGSGIGCIPLRVELEEGVHDWLGDSKAQRGFIEVVPGLGAFPDGLVEMGGKSGVGGGAHGPNVVSCVFLDASNVVSFCVVGSY